MDTQIKNCGIFSKVLKQQVPHGSFKIHTYPCGTLRNMRLTSVDSFILSLFTLATKVAYMQSTQFPNQFSCKFK